jgi:hypothetical protein
MFNAEVKERFVKSHSEKISVRTVYRQFFDIAQKYEEQWNADLCTRTPEVLNQFLNEASGVTAQSQATAIHMLKAYVKWCLGQEDISGVQEDLLSIDSFSSTKLKERTVTSPVHLQRYLDAVFEQEDSKTIDNVYRTYFWMAYAGINQDDAIKIRNKDIDFSEMLIRYNGIAYPIYREGIKAIRYSVELDHFKSIRTNTGKSVVINRFDGDIVMRGRKSVFTNQSLQERVSRKQRVAFDSGKTDLKLSYFKVWLSGLFYRVYIDEISGIKPNFVPFIAEISQLKGLKKKQIDITRQAKYYYEDYLHWKESLIR